ncbi:MAG: 4-hydroxy-tetrahydrodipicolinate reductase, partial [Planctomycetales bacterium]|nr:4-hydroxy-tetrahydrodipicolinate reductase [Planctomycetales bacterium]
MTISLAIHGAAGRMGQRLIALGSQDKDFRLVAAIDHASHPALGQDAGTLAGVGSLELELSSHWPSDCEVAIDFSVPAACAAAV